LILIAEDAGIQVKLAQICLERANYRVVAARDGMEALHSIQTLRPDLVLLDVDMPVMNGFQVLDRLRSDAETCHIPVIMLTAHAKDSGLFAEWATPRDEFMTKPFSPNELLATVKRVLAAPPETDRPA
jgi:chemosensory pili system protein ChpA (sensor histidine kinase/response regulator)